MVTASEWDGLIEGTYGTVDQDPYQLTEEEADAIGETYDAPETGVYDPTYGIAGGLVTGGTGDFSTVEESQEETVRITEDTTAGGIADSATGVTEDSDTDPEGWIPSVVDDVQDATGENPLDWLDWFKWVALAAVLLYLAKPALEIGANLSEG